LAELESNLDGHVFIKHSVVTRNGCHIKYTVSRVSLVRPWSANRWTSKFCNNITSTI